MGGEVARGPPDLTRTSPEEPLLCPAPEWEFTSGVCHLHPQPSVFPPNIQGPQHPSLSGSSHPSALPPGVPRSHHLLGVLRNLELPAFPSPGTQVSGQLGGKQGNGPMGQRGAPFTSVLPVQTELHCGA